MKVIDEDINIVKNKLTALFDDSQKSVTLLKSIDKLNKIINESLFQYIKKSKLQIDMLNNQLNNNIDLIEFKNSHKIDDIKLELNENGSKKLIVFKNNKELDLDFLSAGQKHILSFFLLQEFMTYRNVSDFIIIDTPLGRLSNENQQMILKTYNSFNQTFLLTTSSELRAIKEKKEYNIYNIKKNDFGSFLKREE